jgi:hypothetical protein
MSSGRLVRRFFDIACIPARTAAAGSSRPLQPSWSGQSSRRSSPIWGWIRSRRHGAGRANRGGQDRVPERHLPTQTPHTSTPAALPSRSRCGIAPHVGSRPGERGLTRHIEAKRAPSGRRAPAESEHRQCDHGRGACRLCLGLGRSRRHAGRPHQAPAALVGAVAEVTPRRDAAPRWR